MLATYIHFTLVNHIEVVSFIAWRGEKRNIMREEGKLLSTNGKASYQDQPPA